MIDLETWGTRPGSALRSIGAVMFDPAGGDIGAEFYVNVDRESCLKAGLHIDPLTVEWWAKQSAEARQGLLVDPKPLNDALHAFNVWWEVNRGIRIWSHGANFDQPILDAAYHAGGAVISPWKFWDSRCTRTVYDIAGIDARKALFLKGGVAHNALDDARVQARAVQAAMRRITVGSSWASPPVTTISKNSGVFE
jgi:hypothetical protein